MQIGVDTSARNSQPTVPSVPVLGQGATDDGRRQAAGTQQEPVGYVLTNPIIL